MTGKPAGPAGQYCQLAKRDCSHPKACQSCVFWREMEVTRTGKTKIEWDCAMAWPVMMGGVTNARLDAVAVSTQEMRNEFADMKAAMGQLIVQLAAARNRALPPPAPMKLIGDDTGNPTLPPYRITSQVEDGEEQRSN